MKITLVAQSVAGSEAFEPLSKELKTRSHDVRDFLAWGKTFSKELDYVLRSIRESDIVLSGMADYPELVQYEIAALNAARELNIPTALFADTYGVCARPAFVGVRSFVSIVFVVNKIEAKRAAALYPQARVVVSGKPAWDKFFFPGTTRKSIRQQLSIAGDELAILTSHGRDIVTNAIIYAAVINAAVILAKSNYKPRVFISLHPGDKNEKGVYGELVRFSQVPVKIFTKADFPSAELVPGMDIVIVSTSSVGDMASCQRIPRIDFFDSIMRESLRAAIGTYEWEPHRLGLSFEVNTNPSELAEKIVDSFRPQIADKMREKAEEHFPLPIVPGGAIKIMADALEEIVNAKQQ